MTVPLLIGLMACDAFDKAKDTIDGLLDPVVVEGIVLGIEPPDNEDIQDLLDQSDYQAGTTVTVFMADAREVDEIETAPITGATVRITGPGVAAPVDEVDAGFYVLTPAQQNVVYTSGDTWSLEVVRTRDGQTAESSATLALPADHDFSGQFPAEHVSGSPIELDFTGLGFDAALVVVLDDAGEVTYSNEPKTIREVYDFTHGTSSPTLVTIPGTAFAEGGVFVVGVAGMVNTDAADLTEMNTALSSVLTGKMRMYGVTTFDVP